MKHARSFAFLCLAIPVLLFAQGAFAAKNRIATALDTLDLSLRNRHTIISEHKHHIDSIKQNIDPQYCYRSCQELGAAYHGLNNDSSIHYYSLALNGAKAAADTASMRYVLPELSERLAKASRFRDAFRTLDTIDITSWNRYEKIHYFSSMSHIYIDAANYSNFAYRRDEHVEKAIESLDSLLTLIQTPMGHGLVSAQKHFLADSPTLALGELNEIFKDCDPFSPEYAVAAYMLATYYKDKPDREDEFLYYLILSANADAKRANGEAVSLVLLGEELMKRSELDRAFRYLSIAGELIGESNSIIYASEIAPALSRFAHVWSKREARTRRTFIIVLAILGAIIVALLLIIRRYRTMRHREAAHSKSLSTSLISRDIYINQLINLCGVYVEGLEEYNRLIARKLKVNQTQDLYEMIESGKMLDEQTEQFFEVFDNAVCKIYPNFIKELNSLLQPDKQVGALPGERLTPELRIIAFMRLGVTDSSRLSKFLGLSLNTIYTYRNRMKSRAKNRETFEQDIENLGKKA